MTTCLSSSIRCNTLFASLTTPCHIFVFCCSHSGAQVLSPFSCHYFIVVFLPSVHCHRFFFALSLSPFRCHHLIISIDPLTVLRCQFFVAISLLLFRCLHSFLAISLSPFFHYCFFVIAFTSPTHDRYLFITVALISGSFVLFSSAFFSAIFHHNFSTSIVCWNFLCRFSFASVSLFSISNLPRISYAISLSALPHCRFFVTLSLSPVLWLH